MCFYFYKSILWFLTVFCPSMNHRTKKPKMIQFKLLYSFQSEYIHSHMSIKLFLDVNFIVIKHHFYFLETFNFLKSFVSQNDALVWQCYYQTFLVRRLSTKIAQPDDKSTKPDHITNDPKTNTLRHRATPNQPPETRTTHARNQPTWKRGWE